MREVWQAEAVPVEVPLAALLDEEAAEVVPTGEDSVAEDAAGLVLVAGELSAGAVPWRAEAVLLVAGAVSVAGLLAGAVEEADDRREEADSTGHVVV